MLKLYTQTGPIWKSQRYYRPLVTGSRKPKNALVNRVPGPGGIAAVVVTFDLITESGSNL
jgi:hypothetical protein